MSMKIFITEEQLKILLKEDFSNREKTIRAAYELMVTASHGRGTDPDGIIKGLKMLKNKEDFYRLNGLFSDGRSDYKSFADMINGEFDYGRWFDNLDDLRAVASEISRIEVGFTIINSKSYPYWPVLKTDINKIMSPIGDYSQTKKSIDDDLPQRNVSNFCRVAVQNAMNRAKKWWMDHLNSTITKQNFITTYLSVGKTFTTNEVNNIFSNYKNLVNKMEYRLYDEKYVENYPTHYPEETYGFAPNLNRGIVFLNCHYATDSDYMYGNVVHEIQHQLTEYYPLAPEKYMNNISSIGKMISSIGLVLKNGKYYPQELKEQSKKYGIPWDNLLSFYDRYTYRILNDKDPGYMCRPTEQISRVERIRATQGFKDGERFTVQKLRPLFNGRDADFNFLIYCWCQRGGDLQSYFDGLSGIALNRQKNMAKIENV